MVLGKLFISLYSLVCINQLTYYTVSLKLSAFKIHGVLSTSSKKKKKKSTVLVFVLVQANDSWRTIKKLEELY